MTTSPDLDAIRSGVLDRMERNASNMRLAIGGAACVELGLLVYALLTIDFSVRLEKAIFVLVVLLYTIILLGLAALGAHVSRVGDRVLAALAALAALPPSTPR